MNEQTIKYLESFSHDVETIDLTGFGIVGVLDLSKFTNLKKLTCEYNDISIITSIPFSIEYINCEHCRMDAIHINHQHFNLKKLYCCYNRLTSLNNLPDSIETLGCENNELTELIIPPFAKFVKCSENKLKKINFDKSVSLKTFICTDNKDLFLEYVPESVTTLTYKEVDLHTFH